MSYDMIYDSINSLINIAKKLDFNFYSKSMHYVMTNNQFSPETKYRLGIDIVDIHIYTIKIISKFNYYLKRYCHKYESEHDFLTKKKNMLYFYNNIKGYVGKITHNINTFLRDKCNKTSLEISEVKIHINSRQVEQYKIFKDLWKHIKNFEKSQVELFNNNKKIRSLEKFKYIDYDNIFEKIANRYIERKRYIELEILKMKYANNINIEYSLSEATENINIYISKCKKDDDIFNYEITQYVSNYDNSYIEKKYFCIL